jgi:hypothetical protein
MKWQSVTFIQLADGTLLREDTATAGEKPKSVF